MSEPADILLPHMGGKWCGVSWNGDKVYYAHYDLKEFARLACAFREEHPGKIAIHTRTPSAGQVGTSEAGRRVAVALWLCDCLVREERQRAADSFYRQAERSAGYM